MTAKRGYISLVCLPPDEVALIAIGGYNGNNRIYVVECLDGEDDTEWRQLAPLPLPLSFTCGGVYFKQRIIGGDTTGDAKVSDMFTFNPSTAGGPGQWVTLKPKLPSPEDPYHITVCGFLSVSSPCQNSKINFNSAIQANFHNSTTKWFIVCSPGCHKCNVNKAMRYI